MQTITQSKESQQRKAAILLRFHTDKPFKCTPKYMSYQKIAKLVKLTVN